MKSHGELHSKGKMGQATGSKSMLEQPTVHILRVSQPNDCQIGRPASIKKSNSTQKAART